MFSILLATCQATWVLSCSETPSPFLQEQKKVGVPQPDQAVPLGDPFVGDLPRFEKLGDGNGGIHAIDELFANPANLIRRLPKTRAC